MVLGHSLPTNPEVSLAEGRGKGPFASSRPGHHPSLTPVHRDLLTLRYLWGPVPMSQNSESSIVTRIKTLMEATAKGMI